jgi:hypothetical protein
MQRRILILGLLAAVAIWWATPRACLGAAERSPSVLEGVAGLEKPLTFTETKIPLGELVEHVAAETGVVLRTEGEVADEPVAVVVKEIPARELLEQLADLLEYRWRRQPSERAKERGSEREGSPQRPTPTYEVYQDVAGKQREAALRQATQNAIQARFREEVGRIREMAALPPAEIQRLVEPDERAVKALRQLPWDQSVAIYNSPEGLQRSQRLELARTLVTPVGRTLGRLIGQLSPQQWALLQQEGTQFLATRPRPGEYLLPPKIADAFRGTRIAPGAPDPEVEEEARRQQARDEWARADDFRVALRLGGDPWGDRALTFWAMVQTVASNGRPPHFAGLPGTQVSTHVAPDDLPLENGGPVLRSRAEFEKDPVLGVKKAFRPQHPEVRLTPFGAIKDDWWRVQELLPELARTFGVNFISDAYFSPRNFLSVPVLMAQPLALADVLVESLQHMQCAAPTWDRHGDLIRLRSRMWFLDRPREVPLGVVRRWKAARDRHGALRLDDYVQIATSLTDDQLAGLGALGMEANLPWGNLYASRHVLRLFGSLTPAQQQALRRGAVLPAARMTARQRALLAAAARQPQPFMPVWSMTAARPAEALALTVGAPYVQRRERHDGVTTNVLEETGPTPADQGAPLASRPATPVTKNGLPEDAVRRFRLRNLTFQVVTDSGKQYAGQLTIPAEL